MIIPFRAAAPTKPLDGIVKGLQEVYIFGVLRWSIKATADLMMCLGGLIPFLPQYVYIRRNGLSDGFSPNVCVALLISNVLRLFFWMVKKFKWPLLVQSIVNILIMSEMLRVCSAFNVTLCRLLSIICGIFSVCCIAFGPDDKIFVEIVGILAVSAESVLGVPQLILNYKRKSTSGLSGLMIILWLLGDLLKMSYVILSGTPIQFAIAAGVQCAVDVALLGQTALYEHKTNAGP